MTGGGRRSAGGDTGASLLMTLGLTAFVGLVMAAMLSYSSASIRAVRSIDGGTARTYDADGALKTAVNQLRNSTYTNEEGTSCPALTVPSPDSTPVVVTCTVGAAPGRTSQPVASQDANRPGQTVLALGTTAGETGIAQESGASLPVQGKVFSAGPITTGTGALESVDAAIVARGTCTGTVVSRNAQGAQVPTVCSAPATGFPAEPNHDRPQTGFTYRPVPVCDASSTVEFLPGYYDDAVGLSALMNGTNPLCAGKTFLFQANPTGPGFFYFDFHNGEGGGLPTGSRVWTINDPNAKVVGGTPQGWTPDASVPAVPGSCVSPLVSSTNRGVRFVFGGDSRIRLTAGALELCGQYSATEPPIVFHGARTGDDTVTPSFLQAASTHTNPTTGPAFTLQGRLVNVDNNATSALLDASVAGVASVTASLQVDLPATFIIPQGSVLTDAKLNIVHRDNNADAASRLSVLQVSAALLRAGAPALTGVPQPTKYQEGPSGTVFRTDSLDLTAQLAKEWHDFQFAGLRVRYDAGVVAPHKVTEHVDAIRLVMSYKMPTIRGARIPISGVNGVASTPNCIGAFPGCPQFETDAGPTVLALQGTLYAPWARVSLRLSGASAPVARAGLIVRALQTSITAAPGYTRPLLTAPTGPPPLTVYFRASVAGKVVGTATVLFTPNTSTVPLPPGRRSVSILTWTVRPTTPGPVNQITNPSFDADGPTQTPSGWSTWGDADADYTEADDSRDGSLAGTHYRSSASYSVYTYQTKSVPNGLYTVKAWVQTTGAGITSQLEVKDHGGAQINLPIVSSTWTQLVRQDINVTNGQATIGVYSGGPAGTWVNFDDVEFFRQ